MPNTPTHPSCNAPLPSCRWRRGHPVTYKVSEPGFKPHTTFSNKQQTPKKSGLKMIPSVEHAHSLFRTHEKDETVPSTVEQHSRLWNPAMALRFAPTTAPQASAPTKAAAPTESTKSLDTKWGITSEGGSTVTTEESCAIRTPELSASNSSEEPVNLDDVSELSENDRTPATVDDYEALSYQIPEEKLHAAMLAPEKTRASYWSTNLYEGPSGETLTTHYCKTFDVAERAAKYFLGEKVVGFDIEWKIFANPASIKQNVPLIQLACENRIALFHLSLFDGSTAEKLMPPTLRTILESPDILKVGVAIKGDLKRVEKYLKVRAQGVFELSRLHNLVEWYDVDRRKASKRKLVSLATQVLQHLQLPMYKGEPLADEPKMTSSVRESDWSLPLDMQQIHYAAADAYAGFRLYHMLEWKRISLQPTPPAVQVCDFDIQKTPSKAKTSRKKIEPLSQLEEDTEGEFEPEDDRHACPEVHRGTVTRDVKGDTEYLENVDDEDFETTTDGQSDEGQRGNNSDDDSACAFQVACAPKEDNLLQQGLPEQDISHYQTRIKALNFRQGPDPSYPVLPNYLLRDYPATGEDFHIRRDSICDEPKSKADPEDTDDEFADKELEEALQALEIDRYGRLMNICFDDSTAGPGDSQRQSIHSLQPSVEPGMDDSRAKGTSSFPSDKLEEGRSRSSLLGQSDNLSGAPGSETSGNTIWSASQSVGTSTVTSFAAPQCSSATAWAHRQLQSTIPSPSSRAPSRIRATIPHLRAYHLWYHQKISLNQIARLLHEPPLPQSTVTSYILQAISLERLEYDTDALREVLMSLPVALRKTRWKGLAEKVGARLDA